MNKPIDEIKKKVLPILRKHKVTKAGIFGSYARGEEKKGNDIDILIEIDESVSLYGLIDLKILLEKRLKKKVDLVEYSLIRKELKSRILNDEIPILR